MTEGYGRIQYQLKMKCLLKLWHLFSLKTFGLTNIYFLVLSGAELGLIKRKPKSIYYEMVYKIIIRISKYCKVFVKPRSN